MKNYSDNLLSDDKGNFSDNFEAESLLTIDVKAGKTGDAEEPAEALASGIITDDWDTSSLALKSTNNEMAPSRNDFSLESNFASFVTKFPKLLAQQTFRQNSDKFFRWKFSPNCYFLESELFL